MACINPSLYKQISKVKEEGAKVIVIAHWGVDFGKVQIKQREYAQLLEEGSRFNYGHGAHMMQSIEKLIELLWCIVSAMEYSIVMENMINVLYLHIVLLHVLLSLLKMTYP